MKHKATENQVKTEVVINTRIKKQFSLRLKKLAVATSLGFATGFAVQVASLP